jgi:putative endonuclease
VHDRQALGRQGEDLAVDHLKRAGYRILERNVRSRWGEIDVIARDGDCLVFVEVRTVRSAKMLPEESIGPRKQRRMAALAMRYLQATHQTETDWRVDVVAVEMDERGQVKRLEHHVSAVEEVS